MDWQTKAKLAAGTAGLGVLGATAWTVTDLARNRGTERVPYTEVGRVDDVELRRYPEMVRVRTTAPSQREAFWRLFDYIDGANAGGQSVSMTAPVETGEAERRDGETIAMTAPVETTGDDAVTMSFFLPTEYTPETAPEPTDEAVELVVDPPRTLAALGFSWWTPRFRVTRQERRLLTTLEAAGIEPTDEPRLLRYDAPSTPPWRRTNEAVVPVDSADVRRAVGPDGEDGPVAEAR